MDAKPFLVVIGRALKSKRAAGRPRDKAVLQILEKALEEANRSK